MTEKTAEQLEIIISLDNYNRVERYRAELRTGDCGPDGELLAEGQIPSGHPEPNVGVMRPQLSFEQAAKGNNFLQLYNINNAIVACGEIGLGANR